MTVFTKGGEKTRSTTMSVWSTVELVFRVKPGKFMHPQKVYKLDRGVM